ncbi:MAG: polyprenyl synthetase family protein [Candidatus Aenigmatarchaeota archaeon]
MSMNDLESYILEIDDVVRSVEKEVNLFPQPDVEKIETVKFAKERFIEGGKRYRPLLAYATYKALTHDDSYEKIKYYMCLMELIHSGLLDIDDVQDKSYLRRGKETTWVKIGVEQAINTGLINTLAMPYKLLAFYTNADKLAKIIGKALYETAIGQTLDIKYRKNPDLTTDIQIFIYQAKTGSYTIAMPMAGAAIIAGFDNMADNLYLIGRDFLSPAFQIKDDILNLFPTKEYGKEFGDDLVEGKPTYVIALFNSRANEKDKEIFYRKIGKPLSLDERIELIKLLEKYNAISDSEEVAKKFIARGLEELNKYIPQTKYSELLYKTIDFGLQRGR